METDFFDESPYQWAIQFIIPGADGLMPDLTTKVQVPIEISRGRFRWMRLSQANNSCTGSNAGNALNKLAFIAVSCSILPQNVSMVPSNGSIRYCTFMTRTNGTNLTTSTLLHPRFPIYNEHIPSEVEFTIQSLSDKGDNAGNIGNLWLVFDLLE